MELILLRPLFLTFEAESSEQYTGFAEHLRSVCDDLFPLDDRVHAVMLRFNGKFCGAAARLLSEVDTLCFELENDFLNRLGSVSAAYTVRYNVFCKDLCSFFVLFSDEEKELFHGAPTSSARGPVLLRHVDPLKAQPALLARPEATRLLNDALRPATSGSMLVAYVRVFEAAFRLKHDKLEVPLHRFLRSGGLLDTRDEVKAWICLRHALAHAPRAHTDPRYDQEAFDHIPRIRQACYDVILNKKNWASRDLERNEQDLLANKMIARA